MASTAEAIAQIESGDNPHAIRFEPTEYAAQIASPTATAAQPAINEIAKLHDCSHETACVIAFSSWGLYQIMGYSLWDPAGFDYPHDFVTYCEQVDGQDAAFADFCQRAGIAWTAEELLADQAKLDAFAARYNGPGNVADYSARLKAALEA